MRFQVGVGKSADGKVAQTLVVDSAQFSDAQYAATVKTLVMDRLAKAGNPNGGLIEIVNSNAHVPHSQFTAEMSEILGAAKAVPQQVAKTERTAIWKAGAAPVPPVTASHADVNRSDGQLLRRLSGRLPKGAAPALVLSHTRSGSCCKPESGGSDPQEAQDTWKSLTNPGDLSAAFGQPHAANGFDYAGGPDYSPPAAPGFSRPSDDGAGKPWLSKDEADRVAIAKAAAALQAQSDYVVNFRKVEATPAFTVPAPALRTAEEQAIYKRESRNRLSQNGGV